MIGRRRLLAALTAVVLGASAAAGQERPPIGRQPPRAALEQRFRQRLGAVVQRRLGLTTAQAERLRASNQRFEGERREVLQTERLARQRLRRLMTSGADSGAQREVGQLLDRMVALQRRRLEIVEREQRELATFLTPVQRAKYFALQDELRRRMETMRRQRGGLAGDTLPD